MAKLLIILQKPLAVCVFQPLDSKDNKNLDNIKH